MNKFDSYEDLEAFRENDDSDQISLENDFLLNESKNIIVDYLIFSSPLFYQSRLMKIVSFNINSVRARPNQLEHIRDHLVLM